MKTNSEGYPLYRGQDGRWHVGSFTTRDRAPEGARIFKFYRAAYAKAAEWNLLEK